MSRTLHIIRHGYRATIEEQDDPILWLVQAMQKAGAEASVLLCGTAVSYAVAAQDASGLSIGARQQTQPPRLSDDLERMVAAGIAVHYVAEDAADRGIEGSALVAGLEKVERAGMGELLSGFERVFSW